MLQKVVRWVRDRGWWVLSSLGLLSAAPNGGDVQFVRPALSGGGGGGGPSRRERPQHGGWGCRGLAPPSVHPSDGPFLSPAAHGSATCPVRELPGSAVTSHQGLGANNSGTVSSQLWGPDAEDRGVGWGPRGHPVQLPGSGCYWLVVARLPSLSLRSHNRLPLGHLFPHRPLPERGHTHGGFRGASVSGGPPHLGSLACA